MHLAGPPEGEKFFAWRWPEARAVSDPDEDLYRGFGLGNASVRQLAGPRVLFEWLRAVLQGNGIGRISGNPLRMSAWFLVHNGRIEWSHVHEHAGARRRWEEMEAVARELNSGATP